MRSAGVLAAVVAALVCAATATAGSAHRFTLRPTTVGTLSALAVVPVKSDFATPANWTGGPAAGNLITDDYCNDYRPRYSDLVVTGKATAQFLGEGTFIRSQSKILASKQMVELHWQRTVRAPHWFDCALANYRQMKAPTAFVALKRLAIPKIAPYVSGLRIVMDVTRADGTTVRMAVDTLEIARGRTEITQVVTLPLASAPGALPGEIALARRLIGRARV